MLQLDLSTEDVDTLRETLKTALSDLRYEINDTDAHDYKVMLRQKQSVLEKVLAQLDRD